jgi:hypothetical protein
MNQAVKQKAYNATDLSLRQKACCKHVGTSQAVPVPHATWLCAVLWHALIHLPHT